MLESRLRGEERRRNPMRRLGMGLRSKRRKGIHTPWAQGRLDQQIACANA
jgi:hypothetical protein